MSVPTYQSNLYQVKAARITRDKITPVLSRFQLSTTEWMIIGQIFEHKDGIRLSELAGMLGVEAPLVTNVVDQLVGKTLVEKHPHPRDKRARLLFLSKKGQDLLPEVEGEMQKELQKIIKGVSSEEWESYLKVLQQIVENSPKR